MTIIRIFLFCVVAFVLIAIMSFVYLKWWQAILVCIGVFALFLFAARLAIQFFVRKIGKSVGGVFEERGARLHGAIVEIHSVEPAMPPSESTTPPTKQLEGDVESSHDDAEEDEPEDDKAFYRMDVTIRVPPPAIPAGASDVQRAEVAAGMAWHPNELVLVDPDDPAAAANEAADLPSMIKMMKQFTSGYRPREIVEARHEGGEGGEGGEGEVIEGPRTRRFSFTVAVPASVRELTFKYYGESFGPRIVLPTTR